MINNTFMGPAFWEFQRMIPIAMKVERAEYFLVKSYLVDVEFSKINNLSRFQDKHNYYW